MNATPSTTQRPDVCRLTLVVPVFNEMEAIPLFFDEIKAALSAHKDITLDYVFINDGSTDDTLNILRDACETEINVTVIDLSRNFGKEAALTAGLASAHGDVVVPIDVDLQDPPSLIPDMVTKWREGYEVVLAKRANRASDSVIKRLSASGFYKVNNAISKTQLPQNVGDFRLMDRAVVEALNQLPESQRMMKGLFAWIGFSTTTLEYVRPKRAAGKTKFNGWKLWNLGLDGITSFSTAPLRVWLYLGVVIASLSFLYALWIIGRVLIFGVDAPGYASLMVGVFFFGGLQLMGIGVMGEYLGRTYNETKRRPVYVVRKTYGTDEGDTAS
jgi:glycosyltransferase involved in cell wall biosynthesis